MTPLEAAMVVLAASNGSLAFSNHHRATELEKAKSVISDECLRVLNEQDQQESGISAGLLMAASIVRNNDPGADYPAQFPLYAAEVRILLSAIKFSR